MKYAANYTKFMHHELRFKRNGFCFNFSSFQFDFFRTVTTFNIPPTACFDFQPIYKPIFFS